MKKPAAPIALLGTLTAAQFFQEYWQKKPLLIRQAIANFSLPISRDELFALAAQDDVEARLINFSNKHWEMKSGPFAQLPLKQKTLWTLLVQGVNLHHAQCDALLQQFRFVPDARLDDLMISYASDGGGVGPHFDSYDVFLLQAHGQRRWKISAQSDLSLIEGMPLKILKNFKPEEEYVLEPGDMLYLPPQYAHDGVAIGECMTYSIGFRAPSYQELGESFLNFMSDTIDLPGRYADADMEPARARAEISDAMLNKITAELNKIQFTKDDITVFLGEFLTEPKQNVVFSSPAKPLTPKRFFAAAQKSGVRLSSKTRLLYHRNHLFMNGESFAISSADKTSLAKLANQKYMNGAEVAAVSTDVMEALVLWYEDGWLTLDQ